jgi:hypothetical protein
MTVVGGARRGRPRRESREIDQIKRLIEIQTQIVELAKQNELTEKQCKALRDELAQRAHRRTAAQGASGFFHNLVGRFWRSPRA